MLVRVLSSVVGSARALPGGFLFFPVRDDIREPVVQRRVKAANIKRYKSTAAYHTYKTYDTRKTAEFRYEMVPDGALSHQRHRCFLFSLLLSVECSSLQNRSRAHMCTSTRMSYQMRATRINSRVGERLLLRLCDTLAAYRGEYEYCCTAVLLYYSPKEKAVRTFVQPCSTHSATAAVSDLRY